MVSILENVIKKKKIYQNKLATQPKPDPFLMTILALSTSGIIHSISVIPNWPCLACQHTLGLHSPYTQETLSFQH